MINVRKDGLEEERAASLRERRRLTAALSEACEALRAAAAFAEKNIVPGAVVCDAWEETIQRLEESFLEAYDNEDTGAFELPRRR